MRRWEREQKDEARTLKAVDVKICEIVVGG